MERGILEKPPVVKSMLVTKCVMSGIFLLIGLVLLTISVTQCIRFRDVEGRAVRLDAIISKVVEGTDSDGYDEYDVYVTYEYLGKEYTEWHMTSSKKEWMDRVGETITIKINPDKPTEELDEIRGPVFWCIFFGMPVLALGIRCSMKMKHRLSWVEMYGMRESAIREDLRDAAKESRRNPFLLSLSVGYIAAGFYIVDVDSIGAAMILLGLMIFGLYCIFRFLYVKKEKITGEGTYYTFKKRVLDKKIEQDSEGDKDYYLLLGYDGKTYWNRYSKSVFNKIPVGTEMVEIVSGVLRLGYWYDKENQNYWML